MNANPFRRVNLTEEQRAAMGARLKQARAGISAQNFKDELRAEVLDGPE
jgi:hypothetical protein